MAQLRSLLLGHRWLTVLLLAAALILRVGLPGGTMLDAGHGRLTVTICDGSSGHRLALPLAGQHGGAPIEHTTCPYAVLGLAAAGGDEPALPAPQDTATLTKPADLLAEQSPGAAPRRNPPARAPPANV